MILTDTLEALRSELSPWRLRGEPIALVPTMGNLHEGHLVLIREARSRARRVVVSIFVNPIQFGVNEDFDSYPRTLEADRQSLQKEGADLLFAPSVAVVYPHGQSAQTRVTVPMLSEMLCGESRPGHFSGVATVVCKLFNMVQPDQAVFGEKDFQQLLVIRRMVDDLAMPVEIIGIPTVRESDGLALSSRNAYLSNEERQQAPLLQQALVRLAAAATRGERDYPMLERQGIEQLAAAGFVPDYLVVRRSADLQLPRPDDKQLVVLAAARLGGARLIDNLRINLG